MKLNKNLKKMQWSDAFTQCIIDFVDHTSLHAFHHLTERNRHWTERILWLLVHTITITSAIFIIYYAWHQFTQKPTFTTMDNQHYSMKYIAFPAVSICSNNKISRIAAEIYAKYLWTKLNIMSGNNTSEFSITAIVQDIRYLGKLIDFDNDNSEEFLKFQDLLDRVDADNQLNINNESFYDVVSKMEYLAPSCKQLLISCHWNGKNHDCADLFEIRRTAEGYCCSFNYVRPRRKYVKRLPKVSQGVGYTSGIVVVLNLSSSDYYYPLMNTIGANILITTPTEFPDSSTGGLDTQVIEPGMQKLIRLDVIKLESVPEVKRYSYNQRGCLFDNEFKNEYSGRYSFIECLVRCKLRSIQTLCGCSPFYMPTNFPNLNANLPMCTLQHIACLVKYKTKWRTYTPHTRNIIGLEHELEDSLTCENCLPLCSTTRYKSQSSETQINIQSIRELLPDYEDNISDLSILKIFFASYDTFLYKKNVVYMWYDIVSNFGGMLGLVLGLSLISFLEIIYFATVRFHHYLTWKLHTIAIVRKLVNMSQNNAWNYKNTEEHLMTGGEVIIVLLLNLSAIHMVLSQDPPPLTTIERDNAWMVTGIVFIVLFCISVLLNVYLWILRLQKIKEFNRYIALHQESLNNKQTQQSRNVWYGGSHM